MHDTPKNHRKMPARPRRPSGRNLALLAGLAIVLAWGWLDVRARALPETGHLGQKTDITSYLAAGRAVRDGQDIYQAGHARFPYLYPPLPALLFVPLSHLSRGQASYAWFLVSLGCVAGSVLLVRSALRPVDPHQANHACLMGLLSVALPLLHSLQRGQINPLPLLCLCLGLWAVTHRRDLLAGMAVAGAAAIKVTPAFAAVYFGWRWLECQVQALRGGTWRPGTLLHHTRPLVGFALGLVLGLWLIPALYMGPQPAAAALAAWRQNVSGGYFHADARGDLFGDTAGIHDTNNKNQSWYRAIVSTASLLDANALQDRDRLQPAWQQRTRWLLAGLGIALAAGLLWLCRSGADQYSAPAAYVALATLGWVGITLGKIAWGHFYVMAYPLMAIAWLLASRQPPGRQRLALRIMLALLMVAYAVHYSIASSPQISDIGGMLLPTTVLAFAAAWLANRRPDTVDCTQPPAAVAGPTATKE